MKVYAGNNTMLIIEVDGLKKYYRVCNNNKVRWQINKKSISAYGGAEELARWYNTTKIDGLKSAFINTLTYTKPYRTVRTV